MGKMQDIIKEIFSAIEQRSDFSIDIMETDKDHIHLLISYPPASRSRQLYGGSNKKAPVNCGTVTQNGYVNTSGKSAPSGAMDISYVLSERHHQKL